MANFDKFDKQVDSKKMNKEVEKAKKNVGDYPEIPKGIYIVVFNKIEVGETKGDKRPMLKIDAVIQEGEFKKSHLFMNRVLFGTKNDANMIASALGFLDNLECELIPEFNGYNDFADLVLDIAEEVEDNEYKVEYDNDAFNSIKITEVF